MKKNMGTIDRAIRTIIAVIIVILLFNGMIAGILAWILAILAAAFIVTSAIGWCPLYKPFGISTCKAGQ